MDAWPNEPPAPSDEPARLWHEGRFAEAALRYAALAAQLPDPAGALLWQGHALRRAGDPAAALTVYSRAAAEAPADPAPHRHAGHTLRLSGRPEEAWERYAMAVALETGATSGPGVQAAITALMAGDPGPPEPPRPARPVTIAADLPAPAPRPATAAAAAPARPVPRMPTMLAPPPRPRMAMLRAGGAAGPRAPVPAGGGIAFDISDLLLHFEGRRTLTGIQRVQASLVGAALGAGLDAAYLAFDRERVAWRAVPAEALSLLLAAAAAGSDAEDPAWIAARDPVLEAARRGRTHVFAPGTSLVNLGNSWGIPDYFRGLRAAQRGAGLRFVPFLHDCVPLVMPEHCVRTLVQDYVRWFSSMGVHAHGVLCNSECTRADGHRFLDSLLPGLELPMQVVRLDADPRGNAAPDPSALDGTRAPRPPEPYVLFVATVESRKDHLTAFRAWLALLRRHGPARVPRLVCVGAQGWHAEAAMNLLEGNAELSRHVVLLHGISDGGLAALYRDCLFTLYNSHYEGWGLPVTESLAWGKVPVVPSHSALLESGEGAAVYVDPQSEASMAAAVERLLFEPGALDTAEASVAALPARRRWDAVLAQVVAALEDFGKAAVTPVAERLSLPLGLHLPLGRADSAVPDPAIALGDLVRDGAGWRPPEEWGTALAGGPARLRLPLPPGTEGLLRLHLEFRAEGGGGLTAALFADSAPAGGARVADLPAGDFATAFPVTVAQGTVALELEIEAPEGTGLRGLMLCRDDDLLARLSFLEAQGLPSPRIG
ncbi:glycosyltransferase family 4 protein [Pararoseomonas indoligenes]|uniref:Glycosyltransferase family 4 protein n=1 Tax=Roseomonas indoligenes TaxID=2820811 RepID=A0A940S958_9PROT|nr:glycosyltransferase family 1 protein [Pararoseomonas indoligenes]MBP0494802.1 glycosyltransferase family 4 protein [Pararoseomonas indoligenes]